jgi:plasmid replication initiation protein
MMSYRLVVQEIVGTEVLTSHTRWLEAVELKEGENQEVYVAFSPRFERIWLESKKRLPDYMEQKPANTGLRSQYALRLYSWAKMYVESGTKKHFALEDLRKVLGLESIKMRTEMLFRKRPWRDWDDQNIDA